jgi:Fic family protein
MVYLPYLQPFDDVNKRVSRLAANIALIRANIAPLSFTDVPQDLHTRAILTIYELHRIDPLKELFIWAYQRSAARYVAVQQTIGEPDPFRLAYRNELRDVIGMVITGLV